MRRKAFLMALFIALGCEGTPTSLEPCEAISDQSLHSGEETVVTACFIDSASALTYTAESSHPEVATTRVEGDQVVILALSPGEATITIRASNEEGVMGETSFLLTIPNRDPEVLVDPEPMQLSQGEKRKLILSNFFSDPDGQVLTYSVEELSLVATSIKADTLFLEGIEDGVGDLVIKASDGLSTASIVVLLSVVRKVTIYADGFEDESGGWIRGFTTDQVDTGMEIRNGRLSVWTRASGKAGIAYRETFASNWEIFAQLKPGALRTDIALQLVLEGSYPRVQIFIGAGFDDDFSVFIYNEKIDDWEAALSGSFDLNPNDFSDMLFAYRDGEYHLSFNGEEPRRFGENGVSSGELESLFLIALNADGVTNQKVSLDSISVSGTRRSSSSAKNLDITSLLLERENR